MTELPGTVYIDIDPSQIPPGPKGDPGPPGAGRLVQKIPVRTGSGQQTASTTWTTAGLSIAITPGSATNEIHLRASGRVGHSTSGTLVFFTWWRDEGGVFTDLTPAGEVGLDCVRPPSPDESLGFDLGVTVDTPNTTSAIAYHLMWKTTAPQAVIGARWSDNDMNVGASGEAMEYAV